MSGLCESAAERGKLSLRVSLSRDMSGVRVFSQCLGLEKAAHRWAGVGGGLWKVVAFELVKDLIGTMRTSGCMENYLGSNKSGLAWLDWAGGVRVVGWDGELSFNCCSTVLPGPEGFSS